MKPIGKILRTIILGGRHFRLIVAMTSLLILSACGEEGNVRDCLERTAEDIGGADHVYMTEVVSVKVWRSYPDGTATRFVKYRVKGSDRIKSATCRW